jgi:N6-adenosine-specific RNA methylase IME4
MIILPEGKWDVIVADPPWSYTGAQDKWGAAAKFYDTMSDVELRELAVKDMMHKQSVLFMWATSPRMDAAIDLMRHWGLTYRGVSFVWVKTRQDGVTPIGAQGVRPTIVKPTVEFVLAGTVCKTGRPLKLADEGVANVVLAPKREHSRKPDEVNRRIDRLYPDASKIELFARSKWPNWDAWGNQVGLFD